MADDEESRLYGPRPGLLLQVHDVLRGAEQNASDAIAFGHCTGRVVERGCGGCERGSSVLRRQVSTQRFGQEGAGPPELLHRHVGGTHVFVGHGALAIIRDERVWAVTGAGVEVLA